MKVQGEGVLGQALVMVESESLLGEGRVLDKMEKGNGGDHPVKLNDTERVTDETDE